MRNRPTRSTSGAGGRAGRAPQAIARAVGRIDEAGVMTRTHVGDGLANMVRFAIDIDIDIDSECGPAIRTPRRH